MTMTFRTLSAAAGCLLALTALTQAENLPLDHPTAAVVKSYLQAVVKQDWAGAAGMLLPTSLSRKQEQMIVAVKNSPTMTEEAAKLSLLGVKDIRDLEKMTPQEAYVADRSAVHRRMNLPADAVKRKQESLKINILGLVSEEGGKVIHAVVRTTQETNDVTINELLLISLVQDKDDSKKWLVVPDMQTPIATPLKK